MPSLKSDVSEQSTDMIAPAKLTHGAVCDRFVLLAWLNADVACCVPLLQVSICSKLQLLCQSCSKHSQSHAVARLNVCFSVRQVEGVAALLGLLLCNVMTPDVSQARSDPGLSWHLSVIAYSQVYDSASCVAASGSCNVVKAMPLHAHCL